MLKYTFLLVAIIAAAPASADDFDRQKLQNWHQFRGPLATGVAPQAKPPLEWSETKNVKWKVPIPGRGSASPIVWGDRIFVLTAIKTDRTTEKSGDNKDQSLVTRPAFRLASESSAAEKDAESATAKDENDRGNARERDGDRRGRGDFGRGGRGDFGRGDFGRGGFGRGFGRGGFGSGGQPTNFHQFVVMCIDRNTGKTIWQRTASEIIPHEGHHQTGSFASASPITDGKQVYAFFGSPGLYCYDLDGQPKWHKDLGDMRIRNSFGEGASPAVYGDTLVITWDHEDGSFIVALDTESGNEKWRKPREEGTTWATPLIVSSGDRAQVITSGETRVRSYDLKSGELLWECGGLGSNPIACPVVYDGVAVAMSGHRDPAAVAVPLTATGDVTGTDKIAWEIDEITPYVSSPVLYDDALYFTKSRNAIVSAVAAKTGKTIINQKRLPEMESIYASPVAADGRVYFFSREGVTDVIKHGSEYEVLATNTLDEPIDATPAVVGNELIIRGEGHLYCIAEGVGLKK